MNKNTISLLLITSFFITACDQEVKHDTALKNISRYKAVAGSPAKNTDPTFRTYAGSAAKKISCCAGPPSRVAAKVSKK